MRIFLLGLILVNIVKLSYANIEKRIQKLDDFVKIQTAKNDILKAKVVELENEVSEFIGHGLDSMKSVKPGVYDNRHSLGITSSTIKHQNKRSTGITAAFHAYLSNNRCHKERETIIFDTEIIDRGGYGDVGVYDKRDGIFEPPTAGVYAFTWTIAAPLPVRLTTELIVSGSIVESITTDSDRTLNNGSGVHPATAFVVADVRAGAHCYIRVGLSDGDCPMVLSDNNEVRTSFSAWAIYSV